MGVLRKSIKAIKDIILVLLMLLSLVWGVIYILPSLDIKFAKFIYNDVVLNNFWDIYFKGYPSLLGILISIINIINAMIGLRKARADKDGNKKRFTVYLSYLIISFGMLVFNWIVFGEILSGIFSG